MTISRPRTRLSDEARFDLSLTAMARERRNRPIGMLVFAACLLLASIVFAVYAVSARASSRAELRTALADQAKAESLVVRWNQLSQTASPQGNLGKPGEFKVSRMEEFATRAGMKNKPNAPATNDDKSRPGIVMNRYIYTEVRDASLGAIIEWIRLGCAEIAGLEVESLLVRPEPAGWKVDVTFRRWERAGT